MKFTAKKTVSEIVIDLEDGCVLKLTKYNLHSMSMSVSHSFFEVPVTSVSIIMNNGVSYDFKTTDKCLLSSLHLLVTNGDK